MANEILKNLTIDGVTFDVPTGDGKFVKVTGDTITGDLIYKTIADASKANNGVSGNLYPAVPITTDSSNRVLARVETIVNTNGEISYYPYVRNYNTSGTQVAQKGLRMTMKKDGTMRAYLESNKPDSNTNDTQIATTAFVQDAIKRRLPVSIISGALQTVTVATGGTAKFTNNFWTAPSNGIAIFNAQPQFAANATGIRYAGIHNVDEGIGGGFAVQAAAAGITTVNCTTVHRATNGQTFRMRYTQTSGGNLSVSGKYRIYFIPD